MVDHPPARSLHTATTIDDIQVFVFGGLHSSTPYKALNDSWMLDTRSMSWRRCACTPDQAPVASSVRILSERNDAVVPLGRGNPRGGKPKPFHERLVGIVRSGVEKEEETFPGVRTLQDSPAPRYGHTCNAVQSSESNSVVLFGGCGGFGYSRSFLNDVHVYDVGKNR